MHKPTFSRACYRARSQFDHADVHMQVRFATYNTSLNRDKAGQLLAELQSGVSAQAANVSAILQTIRADILVLNEFDYEPNNAAVQAFQDNFLSVAQAPGLEPLRQVRPQLLRRTAAHCSLLFSGYCRVTFLQCAQQASA